MIADEVVCDTLKADAESFAIMVPSFGVYENSLAEKLIKHPYYEKMIVGAQVNRLLHKGFLWLKGVNRPSLLVVAGERACDPIVKQLYMPYLEQGVLAMPEGITSIAVPAVFTEDITMGDYYAALDKLPHEIIMCRSRPWWEEP